MGLKKYFMDNETYGADDVNAAFSHLVTSGVSLFNGTKSLISELDEAISDTVNSGVDTYNEDSCKVVYENGAYSVKPGVCFMPNGMQIEVDSDGYTLSVPEGGSYYVYAEYSAAENELRIAVSQTQGGEGSVPLAKINADGTVEDRRVFASAKVGLTSANQYKQADNISVKYYTSYSIAVANCTEINAGFAGFKYVYIDADSADGHTELIDVSDCKEHQFGTSFPASSSMWISWILTFFLPDAVSSSIRRAKQRRTNL